MCMKGIPAWKERISEQRRRLLNVRVSHSHIYASLTRADDILSTDRATVPTEVSGGLFVVLSDKTYPALRIILNSLNQYGLDSLRSSCRNLRSGLPTIRPKLGGYCMGEVYELGTNEAGQSFLKAMACQHDPTYNKLLRWENQSHGESDIWQC